MVVKKFRHGSDLVNYSKGLAVTLHGAAVRDTGELFWKHPVRVSESAETGLKESELKPSALAAALLHDVREDVAGIQLYDPFNPPVIDKYNPTRLNDLLSDAGNRGIYACYMIYRLTRPKNESYPDFMNRIISTSGDGVKRILDYTAIWLKICDRDDNSDPDEELDLNAFVRNRPGWEGSREDAINEFRQRQITNADDNIKYYLPMAESLIIGLGASASGEKRVFSEEIAVNHDIFDYPAIRERFKRCWRQSAQILDRHEPCPYGSHLELAARAGYNRGIEDTPGYTRVLTETLKENGFAVHLPAASSSASRLR